VGTTVPRRKLGTSRLCGSKRRSQTARDGPIGWEPQFHRFWTSAQVIGCFSEALRAFRSWCLACSWATRQKRGSGVRIPSAPPLGDIVCPAETRSGPSFGFVACSGWGTPGVPRCNGCNDSETPSLRPRRLIELRRSPSSLQSQVSSRTVLDVTGAGLSRSVRSCEPRSRSRSCKSWARNTYLEWARDGRSCIRCNTRPSTGTETC